MIQIIGWMACVYLIAKGIEFAINPQNRETVKGEGEDWHRIKPSALLTAWGLWIAAVIFFFLLNYQASKMPELQPTYSSYGDCLGAANTAQEIEACSKYTSS